MTPQPEVIHDPRKAVLRRLARSATELDEVAKGYVEVGMFDEGEVAHEVAMRVLRAYRVELDDPEPVR